MSEVVNPNDMQLSMSDGKAAQDEFATSEEARQAVPAESEKIQNVPTAAEPHKEKENKWKLAFRQLMFMKRMDMHFNDRTKNEIELRQQNISATSLICSVPYFNTFSAEEIKALVAASRRVSLRPGETLSLSIANATLQQEGDFCIVNSGHLALAKVSVPSAMALKQASMYPQLRLGIGDYFCVHGSSEMKVIAMELTEYLKLPMKMILELNAASCALIDADKNDLAPEASEMESFKRWALQFSMVRQKSEYPTAEPGGYANCSVKTFCKDHFPNITPENELDHTLEYVKNALMSIFSASKVRIYALDEVNKQLVVKFSDEKFSKSSVGIGSCTGQRVLDMNGPICISDATELLHDGIDETDVAHELYQSGSTVLAAPFFEFDALQANGGSMGTSKIIGVLEVVIEPSDHEYASGLATSNDFCILEFVTEEIGRYLFFHYERFFHDSPQIQTPSSEIASTESFPSPPEGPVSQDHRVLVLNIGKVLLNVSETASLAKISIQHGSTILYETSTLLRFASYADANEDKSHSSSSTREIACDPNGGIEMGLRLIDMPHGSHLKFTFTTKTGNVVAWSGLHLFDFGHTLRTGTTLMDIVLLPAGSAIITPLDIENCIRNDRLNQQRVGSMEITLECSGSCPQSFAFSSLSTKKGRSIAFRASIFSKGGGGEHKSEAHEPLSLENMAMDKQKLLQRLRRDPLVELSPEDRFFIWKSRSMLMEDSALLPAFLLSVDWGNREQVLEAYRLLLHWKQPTYLQALQLLSPLYSDPKVRAYAVRCMHALPDYRLQLYLLQLVQALKNERYHDSALARFLLMRALTNPPQIGYLLYWFLKAESHNHQTAERFNLITSQYLQLCGSYKLEIRQSVYVMKKLEETAAIVKAESSSTARKAKLHEALREIVLPDTFQLPLQPRSYCNNIIVESCRVMESKKRPLFLQFESAKAQHGRPYVIFKAGDDLRQDQLVLQILRVMDDLWREDGLDLCLLPYACISTGDEIGMIEVVGDAETLASIIYARHANSRTKLGRKLNAAKDALVKDGVLSDWLFKQPGSPTARATSPDIALDSVSPTGSPPSSPAKEEESIRSVSSCFPISPRRRKKATASRDLETTQNFVRSCAGYCVATYVLGIGDRHNDNIMLQRSGKFFHIDFGHFLGNFKSKLGVKRERAPFVFTPSMLDTMGGKNSENYQQFQKLACEAFQVLRTNSNLLITLLVLALTCGIPELHSVNCIKWVNKTLMLELPDDEACEAFKKLIHVALHTTTTKLNDAVHLMAH